MTGWTKQEYIANYPDGPEGRNAQLVNEGDVIRAYEANRDLMDRCLCSWDGDDEAGYQRFHNAACEVHDEDGEREANSLEEACQPQ